MNNSLSPFAPCGVEVSQHTLLVAAARRLEALTEMLAAEKNRRHAASLSQALPAIIRRDVERSIQTQQRAIQRLTRTAQEFLLSIPGVGATSALHLLAELTLLPARRDVRQWVAYAGLDPREYTSGTSVHKKVRISIAGNHHLRRALYMPARVAVVHEPHLRAFHAHLLARGKTKMQALVATMRKLLHALFGMFKHDQLFDGARVYALTSAPLTALAAPAPQEVPCP
jgi:transposase